jgi:DNA-binding MarR family transcriptional regulator
MKLEKLIKVNKPLQLSKRTVVNLLLTGNYIALQLNNSLKSYGITLQQFNVLRILRGQKGDPLNLFEIQERMINKNSNTTRLIDKLVTKQYVKRVTDVNNRRKIKVSITEKGIEFLNTLDEIVDKKEEKRIVKNLNDKELEQLNQLLEKIRD